MSIFEHETNCVEKGQYAQYLFRIFSNLESYKYSIDDDFQG
jgi:hypothetical protein